MDYPYFWNKFLEILRAKSDDISFLLKFQELTTRIRIRMGDNKPALSLAAIEAIPLEEIRPSSVKHIVMGKEVPVAKELGNFYSELSGLYFKTYERLEKIDDIAIKTIVQTKLQSLKQAIMVEVYEDLLAPYEKENGKSLEGWSREFLSTTFKKDGEEVTYGAGDDNHQMFYEALQLTKYHTGFLIDEAKRLDRLGLMSI